MASKLSLLGVSGKTATVSGGWWLSGSISAANCIGAYQAKGVASLAASYTNLANSGTYNLTAGTAPAWDATNGWIFDGYTSKRYLKTGIAPENDQTWSMIVRYSGSPAIESNPGSITLAGAVANSPYGELKVVSSTSAYYGKVSNGDTKNFAGTYYKTESGVIAVAGTYGYLNGEQGITGIPTVAGTIPEIYIGARNMWDTTIDEYATVNVQAIAIYDAVLSEAQVAALTTAMNAL